MGNEVKLRATMYSASFALASLGFFLGGLSCYSASSMADKKISANLLAYISISFIALALISAMSAKTISKFGLFKEKVNVIDENEKDIESSITAAKPS